MLRFIVALGGNLGGPAEVVARFNQAATRLAEAGFRLYATAPVGGPEQPDFVNAVASGPLPAACGQGAARALLEALLRIETELGRTREVHWGPRTLDLDLIAFGDERASDPDLILPHPRTLERGFVVTPLQDVEPDWIDPVTGGSLQAAITELDPGQRVALLQDDHLQKMWRMGSIPPA